ncbi:OmpA family protein [Desulfosarcina sp.]|uniref:OmpA family protein n=1 Tax=Desulfosarcina sp. TaxID=2027861 RepID=UPI0029A5EA62|nr:OmpA family protein [Desulfosarcina sp.]MDX2454433.1 OmpA family protein [Desulfosarcina sp.]MDX2492080.1 OmpA family protein [Desulfosarcina sp.]
MKNWARRPIWISLVIVGLALTGCVQSQMAGSAATLDPNKAMMDNPVEWVNQLSSDISEARMAQLNILSPDRFKKAESAFFSAQKDLEKGNEIADIRKAVMESRDYLQQAEEIATISRTTLTDTLKAREMARSAGAAKFENEYRRVENDFLDLTRAIERDNLSYAQNNRSKVLERYRELEVRAIKEETIGEVRTLIARAEAADARKIAPLSYGQAVDQINATDAFISANPYAKEEMHAMAREALFKANRLVVVTEQSNQIKTMEPEAIVLLMENHLHTISAALGAQDMRDQAYQTQLDNIIGSVNSLNSDRLFMSEKNQALQAEMESIKADYQAQIDAFNVRVATLEGKTREDQMAKERMAREHMAVEQRLAAERKFNQLYVAVQSYFESDEAEVYKQENQLVIRLKAMRFPVGKSIIMPENYALLSKVQKAIRTFDDPRVIVEGHTDATGSDEVNMLLSQQRAEAVREYMIANQTLPPDSLSAVGYGSERPLASNATAAGRAINRRIDILIIPEAKSI